MKPSSSTPRERLARVLLYTVLLAAIWLSAPPRGPNPYLAKLAEQVSNGRSIKLIMDSFAMDHNGAYPNEALAQFYGLAPPESSNDLFQQLFASDNTTSERIFWIHGAKVCNKQKPDDVTASAGQFSPAETLQPGDNAWAMVENQTNTSNSARPLIFESPPTAAGLIFDGQIWDKKTIVVRIDGSARPERLNPENRLLDDNNVELLTPASEVWGEFTKEVSIAYPEPARK